MTKMNFLMLQKQNYDIRYKKGYTDFSIHVQSAMQKEKNDMQLYTSYEQAKKERKNLWKTQE